MTPWKMPCRIQKNGEINIVMGDYNAKLGTHREYPTTGGYGIGTVDGVLFTT